MYKKEVNHVFTKRQGRIKNNKIVQSNNFTEKIERFYRFFADSRKIRENLKLDGEVLIGGVVDVILLWRDIDYG